MIQMEVKICTIDQTPIEHSAVYQIIKSEQGEEVAEQWTDIITVPKDDP